jgi:hypothetical protein
MRDTSVTRLSSNCRVEEARNAVNICSPASRIETQHGQYPQVEGQAETQGEARPPVVPQMKIRLAVLGMLCVLLSLACSPPR